MPKPRVVPAVALVVDYYREHRGLTQAELAEKIGISRQTLIEKLAGRKDFGSIEIERCIEALNVSIEEFDHAVNVAATYEGEPLYFPERRSVAAGRPIEGQSPVLASEPMWVKVQGDSMSPRFEDGWKVLVKRVLSVDELAPGDAVVVSIAGDKGDGLYEFYRHDDGRVRLLKRNAAAKYRKHELELGLEDIAAVYKVVRTDAGAA